MNGGGNSCKYWRESPEECQEQGTGTRPCQAPSPRFDISGTQYETHRAELQAGTPTQEQVRGQARFRVRPQDQGPGSSRSTICERTG